MTAELRGPGEEVRCFFVCCSKRPMRFATLWLWRSSGNGLNHAFHLSKRGEGAGRIGYHEIKVRLTLLRRDGTVNQKRWDGMFPARFELDGPHRGPVRSVGGDLQQQAGEILRGPGLAGERGLQGELPTLRSSGTVAAHVADFDGSLSSPP